MNSPATPQIGDWYERSDTGETFRVVSVDVASATVQVQSFDGELDGIDAEEWAELPLVAAAEPEDWTGAIDDVEPDEVTEDDSPADRA